jgi:hypothetical protein
MSDASAEIPGKPSLKQQIIQVLYRKAGTWDYSLAQQADEILELIKGNEPPGGWFHFGSHVDWEGQLELSEEVGEDGLPQWERPLPLTAAAEYPRFEQVALFGE